MYTNVTIYFGLIFIIPFILEKNGASEVNSGEESSVSSLYYPVVFEMFGSIAAIYI